MFPRARLLTALVLAAAVLGACGGGGEEEDIEAVVSDFSAALLDTDGPKACALLTEAAIEELTQQPEVAACEKAVDGAGEPTDDDRENLEDPEVTDIEVDGDTATAQVTATGEEGESRTRFRRVDGDWKIDSRE